MNGTACQQPPVGDAKLRARVLVAGDPPDLSLKVSLADAMYDRSNKEHYFAVGRSALACVRSALREAGRPDPNSILDLPCGHGRVLRFLHAAYPTARFTACDLLRDGVDFCAETFGAEPVYSSVEVKRIRLRRRFDLIWCGSLLTHLDAPRWPEFLRLFARALMPEGICAFTTDGSFIATCMRERRWNYGIADQEGLVADWDATGFGFRSYANQPGYGLSLSSEHWIRAQVDRVPQLQWVAHRPRAWDNHQDVVVIQRRENRWFQW